MRSKPPPDADKKRQIPPAPWSRSSTCHVVPPVFSFSSVKRISGGFPFSSRPTRWSLLLSFFHSPSLPLGRLRARSMTLVDDCRSSPVLSSHLCSLTAENAGIYSRFWLILNRNLLSCPSVRKTITHGTSSVYISSLITHWYNPRCWTRKNIILEDLLQNTIIKYSSINLSTINARAMIPWFPNMKNRDRWSIPKEPLYPEETSSALEAQIRRRGSNDAIVEWCAIWLAGATILWSRRSQEPEGSKDATGRWWRWSRTGRRVVRNRVRSYRRREKERERRLPPYPSSTTTETVVGPNTPPPRRGRQEGGSSVGESRRTLAPHVPLSFAACLGNAHIFEIYVYEDPASKISRWFIYDSRMARARAFPDRARKEWTLAC